MGIEIIKTCLTEKAGEEGGRYVQVAVPQINWMDVFRQQWSHYDTIFRAQHPLVLQQSRAYNVGAQTVDINLRQITQIIDVVGAMMSLSP